MICVELCGCRSVAGAVQKLSYMTRNNIYSTENKIQSKRNEIKDWTGTRENVGPRSLLRRHQVNKALLLKIQLHSTTVYIESVVKQADVWRQRKYKGKGDKINRHDGPSRKSGGSKQF